MALDADSNRLAVGAYGDDGSGSMATDSGALYLYSFANTSFGSGSSTPQSAEVTRQLTTLICQF